MMQESGVLLPFSEFRLGFTNKFSIRDKFEYWDPFESLLGVEGVVYRGVITVED